MALTKLTTDVQNIQKLADRPNQTDGLTAAQVKATYDKAGEDIKAYINDTLTAEIDENFTTKDEITTNRKLSETGDFGGTINGLQPIQIDPYVSAKVAQHTTQLDEISVNVLTFECDDGQLVKGDGIHDDTTGIQAAIDYCIANHLDLLIPKLCRITAPLNIDRQVDSAEFDSYFTILTHTGGGIYVDSAISMFSTRISFSGSPVSQLVRWKNLRFVASSNSIGAYVIDGSKFLRSEFNGCSFSKMKCMLSTTYVQSIYFINCNARRWSGAFFKCSPQGYDIQVMGGLYEAGAGDGFDISSPIGCKFLTQIEGVTGTALKINGSQGVDISTYFETNGFDIDSRTGGLENVGINIHGSYFSHMQNNDYSIKWGKCSGCSSKGNWHTNNMHDLQADSVVDINDIAQTNLSNAGGYKTNGGYREGNTGNLVIRGINSDSYAVSGLTSVFTRSGNRANIEFICTLTSTGTNGSDNIYIPSSLDNAAYPNMLCGEIEVVGSTANNGISPLFISSAAPMRIQSSKAVIPANTTGNSWTVRGCISYIIAS